MAKKNKEKKHKDKKKKNKKKDKADAAKSKADNAETLKANEANAKKGDNKKGDNQQNDAKAAATAGAASGKRQGRKSRQDIEEPQYVSPFAENPDDALGFGEDQAADLADLEHMLNVEVDEDFFVEPRYFHTLRRVINVLGIQVNDEAKEDLSGKSLLERNPAYQNLQKQAQVVENAIEHMSRVYCNALNRSVIQVGRIAREFDEAIEKVETLRRQVRVIQGTIGARRTTGNRRSSVNTAKESSGKDDEDGAGDHHEVVMATKPGTQMSLRELWMKKLESEALLSLINKINIVRDAPGRFDDLTMGKHNTCRIGAATRCLTEAISTMFADDVSEVGALSQILENLMLRKTTCEEVLWETLEDILYLRTSNGNVLEFEINLMAKQQKLQQQQLHQASKQLVQRQSSLNENIPGGGTGGLRRMASAEGDQQQHQDPDEPTNAVEVVGGPIFRKHIYNPFHRNHMLLCVEDTGDAADDVSIDSQASEASVVSKEDYDENHPRDNKEGNEKKTPRRTLSSASDMSGESADTSDEGGDSEPKKKKNMMIPQVVVESDLDLVADELRCFDFETKELSKATMQKRYMPRYSDPVLSLRIVVECLARIGRLQKAEGILMKNVEAEIKRIIQREQARTFYRLDRRKGPGSIRTSAKEVDELKDFRRHFTAVLSSLGCIMMRLSHLAQLSRARIWAEPEMQAGLNAPSNFLRPVIEKAYSVIQNELKNFLRACLQEHLSKGSGSGTAASPTEQAKNENKIFTFGVLEGFLDGEEKEEEGADGNLKQEAKPDKKPDQKQADKKQEQKQPEPEPDIKPEEEAEKDKKEGSRKYVEMPASTFVSSVLFPMTNTTPAVQHALVFRRSMDKFTRINEARAKELALVSGEKPEVFRRKSEREELAIEFLDKAIQDTVLPSLQQDAVRGTIIASEMQDAFEPPTEANVYARADKIQPLDVIMVQACEGMLEKTEPLFLAIHRLPPGGEMYQVLVQVLMFLIETFNSLVEPQVADVCDETTAEELLEGFGADKGKLMSALGRHEAFIMLLEAYEFDLDLMDDPDFKEKGPDVDGSADEKESPEKGNKTNAPVLSIEREESILKEEMELLNDYLDFMPYHQESLDYDLITKGELKKATCLAHSLLKVASILERRLKSRAKGVKRMLENTEELHDKIKILKSIGIKMAKFCHLEVLLQVIHKLAPTCKSTTLCAKGAVRVPTTVNGLCEYLTGTMEYLRETTSNAMAAYTFSNLGQYIPACLMSTVRVIAAGEGIIVRAPLTMNGIESLDRSAAVLYKDLKAAIGFQSKFFNIQLTAISFERAATFTALMEMSIEELAEYYTTHSQSEEFSDDDFEIMFKMDGPRRIGDDKQFKKLKNVIKKRKKEKEEKKETGQAQAAQQAA